MHQPVDSGLQSSGILSNGFLRPALEYNSEFSCDTDETM